MKNIRNSSEMEDLNLVNTMHESFGRFELPDH
jgi:hypothetical protein